jgi:hypothetical protein
VYGTKWKVLNAMKCARATHLATYFMAFKGLAGAGAFGIDAIPINFKFADAVLPVPLHGSTCWNDNCNHGLLQVWSKKVKRSIVFLFNKVVSALAATWAASSLLLLLARWLNEP